jgi:thiamine pyrophosphokinase
MSHRIVSSQTPVVMVGGGVCPALALDAALTKSRTVVAADSGAEALLARGIVPEAVYGDMDSLSAPARASLPEGTVVEIAEQDSTDFDKALRHVDAPLVLAFGFLGARFDHALAALTVLAARPDRRCILVGETDAIALLPPRLALDLEAGTRVSLYPLGPVTGRSEGLRWPIAGIRFAPGGRVGTSNAATGPVSLETDAPLMVLILPLDCLPLMQAALLREPVGWPARAG